MIALLDIGSTLIEGPPYGPARRLAEMLGCAPEAIGEIERLLFRTPCEGPDELAEAVARRLSLDVAAVEEACTTLWQAQLREAFTLPGAREAIGALDRAGIERAYLSNIWPPFYAHFRREFPKEAERPQFLSFALGMSKPDRAVYAHVLDQLGVAPDEVVMIGDTYENDMRPAIEMGMRTVWVLHRPEKERAALVDVLNGQAPQPDVTIASIGQLDLGIFTDGN